MLIWKDAVGASHLVFNQRTMLSYASRGPAFIPVTVSWRGDGFWMAPFKRWKSDGASVVKQQERDWKRGDKSNKKKVSEPGSEEEEPSVCVWAALNNLLLLIRPHLIIPCSSDLIRPSWLGCWAMKCEGQRSIIFSPAVWSQRGLR